MPVPKDIQTFFTVFRKYQDKTDAAIVANTGGVGPQGPPGNDGAPGAPGPNSISTATVTTLSGMIKGNGTSVVLASSASDYATATHTQAWTSINSGVPTTISGYGITDAASTGSLAAHTSATGAHGVAQVAGTADITTHANSTATHGVAGTIAAKTDIPSAATSVLSETSWGVAAAVGSSTLYARSDHTHGTPSAPAAPSSVYLAGTQSFSSTALANVTGLNFACASTTLYHYRFIPMFKSGTATVGVKFAVTWPSSTIAAGQVDMAVLAAGTTAKFHGNLSASGSAVTGTSVVAASTITLAVIEGLVKATASGSIQLQAAAEAAGTVWIMDGSIGYLTAIF